MVVIKPFHWKDLSSSDETFLSLAEVNSDHLRHMVLYYNLTNLHSNRTAKTSIFPKSSIPFSPTFTNVHFSDLSAIPFPITLPVVTNPRIHTGCHIHSRWYIHTEPKWVLKTWENGYNRLWRQAAGQSAVCYKPTSLIHTPGTEKWPTRRVLMTLVVSDVRWPLHVIYLYFLYFEKAFYNRYVAMTLQLKNQIKYHKHLKFQLGNGMHQVYWEMKVMAPGSFPRVYCH